jgi:hypothetical protein
VYITQVKPCFHVVYITQSRECTFNCQIFHLMVLQVEAKSCTRWLYTKLKLAVLYIQEYFVTREEPKKLPRLVVP